MEQEVQEKQTMGRREMLLKAGAATGFVTLVLAGCDDSSSGGGTDGGNNKMDSGNGNLDSGNGNQDSSVPDDSSVPNDAAADAKVDAQMDASNGPVVDITCVNAPTVETVNSHTHTLSMAIPIAHFETIQQRTYVISGSGHTHNVMLSVSDFNNIIAGSTVTVTSGGGHQHDVTWTGCNP
ncbi:MAG: hypothetical protein R3A78_16560 [Polyangiales bacterium]|nr:hypothetical protein [Myxococcales bacterium]